MKRTSSESLYKSLVSKEKNYVSWKYINHKKKIGIMFFFLFFVINICVTYKTWTVGLLTFRNDNFLQPVIVHKYCMHVFTIEYLIYICIFVKVFFL